MNSMSKYKDTMFIEVMSSTKTSKKEITALTIVSKYTCRSTYG